MAGIEELPEDSSAEEMVLHLAKAHEKLLNDLKVASADAAELGDSETEDRNSQGTGPGNSVTMLVVSQRKYRLSDYFKVGLPLLFLTALVTIFLAPRLFPF